MKTSTCKAAKTLSAMTAFAVVTSLGITVARAQQSVAVSPQQLQGTWNLVSVEVTNKAGVKEHLLEGGGVKGVMMFDPTHFSYVVISNYPKLVSNDRLKTTPEENKAVAHGVLAYYGTYALNPANGQLTLRVERSSFQNQNGRELKIGFTSFSPDEMRYTVLARTSGGSTAYVWRRAR